MNCDYYSCIEDKENMSEEKFKRHSKTSLIVDESNIAEHASCTLLGMFYNIKNFKKKLMPGLISKKLINHEKEKLNVIKYENREIKEKKQKLLAQKRFETEIPSGSIVINLAEILK